MVRSDAHANQQWLSGNSLHSAGQMHSDQTSSCANRLHPYVSWITHPLYYLGFVMQSHISHPSVIVFGFLWQPLLTNHLNYAAQQNVKLTLSGLSQSSDWIHLCVTLIWWGELQSNWWLLLYLKLKILNWGSVSVTQIWNWLDTHLMDLQTTCKCWVFALVSGTYYH